MSNRYKHKYPVFTFYLEEAGGIMACIRIRICLCQHTLRLMAQWRMCFAREDSHLSCVYIIPTQCCKSLIVSMLYSCTLTPSLAPSFFPTPLQYTPHLHTQTLTRSVSNFKILLNYLSRVAYYLYRIYTVYYVYRLM